MMHTLFADPRLMGRWITPSETIGSISAVGRQHKAALVGDGRLGDRRARGTDALDYYAASKILDGLVDTVFRGVHREYALGNTPEQRFMGHWSDGTPIRELIVEWP